LIPTCLDFGIEIAFPVQPQIITGVMGMTAQLSALVIGMFGISLSTMHKGDFSMLGNDQLLIDQTR
jgi:hypothetical protein